MTPALARTALCKPGRLLLLIFSLLLLVGTGACKPSATDKGNTAGSAVAPRAAGTSDAAGSTPDELSGGGAMPAPEGDVKQVIIIYTGDTISAMESQTQDDPPRGGLSALASALVSYQREIVEFTAKRVENEGGDPSTIKADFANGMLGPHPRLLLDYGGWERPNDEVGGIYTQLYANFFHDFCYTAVGGMRYQELQPEIWREYKAQQNAPTLLVSAGSPLEGVSSADLLPTVKVVTRECHGQRWGIACIPIPGPKELTPVNPSLAPLEDTLSATITTMAGQDCDFRILLAGGHPATLFNKLRDSQDFDLVIGGPLGLSAHPGMGDLPQNGPLILPALDKAGRQIGICHLIYSKVGSSPTQYNFILRDVIDSGAQTQPYFKQVAAARAAHKAAAASHRAK